MLAAMGDSITREELVREVGDRLDADPALVSRRLGGSAAAWAAEAAAVREARLRRRRPRPGASRGR